MLYGRSAACRGHDLVTGFDARRKAVVQEAVDPVPVQLARVGLVTFQRGPSGQRPARRYVHSYDTTAARLSVAHEVTAFPMPNSVA